MIRFILCPCANFNSVRSIYFLRRFVIRVNALIIVSFLICHQSIAIIILFAFLNTINLFSHRAVRKPSSQYHLIRLWHIV